MHTIAIFALLAVAFGSTVFVPPFSPQVTYLGRFDFSTPESVQFDWAGVEIGISFQGSQISILLQDVGNWYDVMIDGATVDAAKVLNTTKTTGLAEYELAHFSSVGQHSIRLVKRTEALFGVAIFGGFLVENAQSDNVKPSSLPRANPTRRIEFLGDSLTCGYGNLGTWPCHFTADTEDVDMGFPAVTARHFGAQLNVECWSGKGVVRNYGDTNTTSVDPFPIYYSRTVANNPNSPVITPSLFDSDAIVICLGANDFSTTPHPPDDVFIQGYVNLIKRVKADHPNAKLFLASGESNSDPEAQVQKTAAMVGASYISFKGIVTDFGCDYHPTKAADAKMAAKIISVVGPAMNWE